MYKPFFFCSGQNVKDVPYSRLIDTTSPVAQLPQKLDSDSKLNTERSKSILSVPEIETAPKSSISDSKLALDYFNATENIEMFESNSPQSLPIVPTEFNVSGSVRSTTRDTEKVNVSDSHHSLYAKTNSDERLKQQVRYIEDTYIAYWRITLFINKIYIFVGTTYCIYVIRKSFRSVLFC